MPDDIVTQGIPHKELAPLLEKLKKRIFNHPVVKDIIKKYDIDKDELQYVPMAFAKLPVSARTDHGVIYFNVDLAKDGTIDDEEHYGVHEFTHYGQQTTGDKPTPGSDEDNYLDNPVEQEGFRNQTKYIADTQGEEEAEKYIDQVIDHHSDNEADDKKREKRKDKLLAIAREFGVSLAYAETDDEFVTFRVVTRGDAHEAIKDICNFFEKTDGKSYDSVKFFCGKNLISLVRPLEISNVVQKSIQSDERYPEIETTFKVDDIGNDGLLRLILFLKWMGTSGSSREILVQDVNEKTPVHLTSFDGDGADGIMKLEVNGEVIEINDGHGFNGLTD